MRPIQLGCLARVGLSCFPADLAAAGLEQSVKLSMCSLGVIVSPMCYAMLVKLGRHRKMSLSA